MPKGTEVEKEEREKAMEAGLKTAVGVPLNLAVKANALWDSLWELAQCGNINCKSDLQVAARCLETAVQGARHNVDINLGNIKDLVFREQNYEAAEKESEKAVMNRDRILGHLAARIE